MNGDAHCLKQILFNLAGNAVKFTENGTISVRAGVVLHNGDAVILRFEVEDTGIGIPEEVREKLFARFTQATASTTRRFGGTGLGLAICKNLAVLMGGEIGVTSTPDVGSTFWFTVPFRPGTRSSDDFAASEPSSTTAPTRQLDILVAEDNKVNQKVIGTMLRPLGNVEIVVNGARAVEAVGRKNYDVIVMDIRMPEMDGLSATQSIRAMAGAKGKVPIIALSADVMPEKVEEYMRAGMNAYIAKPIDSNKLITTIAEQAGTELRDGGPPPPPSPSPSTFIGPSTREDASSTTSEAMDALLKRMDTYSEET